MVKLFVGILLVLTIANQGYAQLRCFTCVDCPDPFTRSDDLLQECPAPTTSTTTTTTTTTTPIPDSSVPTISTTEDITTTTTTTEPVTPPTSTLPELTSPTTTTTTQAQSPPEGTPTTTVQVPTSANLDNRQENDNMRCFRVETLVNENTVINRGCVQIQADNTATCALANGGTPPANCDLCDDDGCNTAPRLAVPFFVILSIIFIALSN